MSEIACDKGHDQFAPKACSVCLEELLAEVNRLKGEPPMTWDAEKQLMRSECTALKAEVERLKKQAYEDERERDELHNGIVEVLATRAQFDAEDPETFPHYIGKMLDDRDAYALALKDTRGASIEAKHLIEAGEADDTITCGRVFDILKTALLRTSDPTVLLEAHDREFADKAKAEGMFEANALYSIRGFKSGQQEVTRRAESLRPSTEAGEKK